MAKAKKSSKINDAYDLPFPTRLRELLGAPGETQGKLADAIGVQRQSIGQWKDGITSPDVNAFNKIANYYNVSADYLLGKTTEKSPDIDVQAIHKKTGLSEKAIRILQSLNDPSNIFNQRLNFKAIEPINSLLEHVMLGKFIVNVLEAKRYSEFKIPEDAIGKDCIAAEKAAGKMGGIVLQQENVVRFFRQEALNVLHEFLYDLVPEKEEEDHGNGYKTR